MSVTLLGSISRGLVGVDVMQRTRAMDLSLIYKALADGQRCGQRRNRRMRKEAEDPIGRGRQLRVVVVVRVAARRIDERGRCGACLKAIPAENGRFRPARILANLRAQDLARPCRRTREDHGDAIRDASAADRERVGWNIGERRGSNEVDDGACRAGRLGHIRAIFA